MIIHPYWIARGLAIIPAIIVAILTVWDPIWIVRGSIRPVWLQCVGAFGVVALLATPDQILASSPVRYRCAQFTIFVFMAAVVNPMNWQGFIAPLIALNTCRSRIKIKAMIKAVAHGGHNKTLRGICR